MVFAGLFFILNRSSTGSVINIKLAFHYGDFDDAYGDGTVGEAATQGRVYANTPTGTYIWGTLGSASTASGQTTYTWTPPNNLTSSVLLVAGGGGGGGRSGAGGGAGGLLYNTDILISGQKTIVVGSGGSGGDGGTSSTNQGSNGYSTSFTSLTTAVGGGGGGSFVSSGSGDGKDGGSGGGGGRGGSTNLGGSAVSGQGNDGGNGGTRSGGGGGAGAVGGNGTSGAGGSGGIGQDFSSQFSNIYGDSGFFAGGGGGGGGLGALSSTAGTGGQGGGADGSVDVSADSGVAHTGGGGGGGGYDGSNGEIGGSGGSGIVLLSFNITENPTTPVPPYPLSNYSVDTSNTFNFGLSDVTVSYDGTKTFGYTLPSGDLTIVNIGVRTLSTPFTVSSAGSLLSSANFNRAQRIRCVCMIRDSNATDYGKKFWVSGDLSETSLFTATNAWDPTSGSWSTEISAVSGNPMIRWMDFRDGGLKWDTLVATVTTLDFRSYNLSTAYDLSSVSIGSPDLTITNFNTGIGLSGVVESIEWVNDGKYCFVINQPGTVKLVDTSSNPYDPTLLVSANVLDTDSTTFNFSGVELGFFVDPNNFTVGSKGFVTSDSTGRTFTAA